MFVLIRKAYKYKLKTNPSLEDTLNEFSGANRFVWNKALFLNKKRLERHEKKDRKLIRYNDLAGLLKLWKQSDEWGFLKGIHSQTLQQTLKDLDKAFKDAFDPKQPLKRFPVFKKKEIVSGFRFPQGIKIHCNRVYLPKIGWVRYFNSKKIEGIIKNATVSKRNGKWFVSIQVEQEIKVFSKKPKNEVGIDLGIKKNVVLSDGRILEGARSFKKQRGRLAKSQRHLSRKMKFSSNWKKQKSKITKIHEKIANVRNDRLHWMSNRLSNECNVIYLEALKVRNMSKSASGTLENPGRNVSAKRGLNREILDQGWGEFRRQLSYKQEWSNGWLQAVDPKYTSQKCSQASCGYTAKENRKSQSVFHCRKCGYEENADVNASKNILAVGQTVFACGGNSLEFPLKQEPLAA